MNAQFISLDGIDGAGKSTNLKVMKNWFARQGLPVLFTREPGGTAAGEALRGLLLNPDLTLDVRTETLLMFAARQQHLSEVILPALAAGTHVVSDRFTDATFAYQGGGRGVPMADIAALESWVQQGKQPDLVLLLDVPLEVSMARLQAGRDEKDRFEQQQADFFTRVRSVYRQRAAAAPARYAVIDSNRGREEVAEQIESALAKHFGL